VVYLVGSTPISSISRDGTPVFKRARGGLMTGRYSLPFGLRLPDLGVMLAALLLPKDGWRRRPVPMRELESHYEIYLFSSFI